MEEGNLTDKTIKKRVASGIFVSGVRKVLFQSILTFSNIILARILAPDIFGIFAIISFMILTTGILVNFGLGPALIQKKGNIKPNQLRAIFTVLFLASLVFVVLIYFLAPFANLLYKEGLGRTGIFWLRLFSISLVLNHTTGISSSLLERKLEYKKLTIGEILTLFITQSLVIFFAIKGLGIGSFVLGNLIGGFLSFFIFFYLYPWPIGFRFSLKDLKPFLPFGLNYQANRIIGAINGAVVPGFVGAVSGPTAVGLINWAGGIRQAGLAPFEVIEKLLFPVASRAQEKKKFLKWLIEKMIKFSSMLSFPLLAAIFALAPSIVSIVYTSKWLAGLTALYLSLIQGVFILLGVVLTDVLFALGKAKTVRNISLFWAILQWVLTVPLVLLWNFNGVVLAGVIVSSTFFIPLREVRKYIEIDIWPNVLPYLAYSVFTGVYMFLLARLIGIFSIWHLILIGVLGASFYGIILFAFKRKEITIDIARFKELVLNK